jgi:hypothetical protein
MISAIILLGFYSRKQVVSNLAKEAKLKNIATAAFGITLNPFISILKEVLEASADDCKVHFIFHSIIETLPHKLPAPALAPASRQCHYNK